MYVKRDIEILVSNHCCRGKAVSIKRYDPVFFSLVTQHAKLIFHASFSCVSRQDLQHFSTLSHKRQEFREKKTLLNLKCVF